MNCGLFNLRYIQHFDIPNKMKLLGYVKSSHWEGEKLIEDDFACPTCGCKARWQVYTAQGNDFICWNCNENKYKALTEYDEYDRQHYIKLIKKENLR